MKPYTYTIYKLNEPTVTKTITSPGAPAPTVQLDNQYSSVFEQLKQEHWDMRDATAQDAQPLNSAIVHAGIARGIN